MDESPRAATDGARDLSRRLALFGVLSVVVGLGAFGLALFNLALPALTRWLPSGPPPDWRAAASGAATWMLIGVAFVWAGLGSMRCRRWCRSVMLTLSWSWLLFGIMALALGWLMLDDLLALSAAQSGTPLPEEFVGVFKAIMAAAVGAVGIALPTAFIWAYRDPDVQRTCEARHPQPDWTEACPTPVLGLSLGLGACGVAGLPLALHAVVPFFGFVVTGPPAIGLVLAGAATCLWLARATYKLEPVGWWGTVGFLVALGATVVVTFTRVDPGEYLKAYGLPVEQADGLGAMGPALIWGSVAVTLASVAYLVAVKKHFDGERPGG